MIIANLEKAYNRGVLTIDDIIKTLQNEGYSNIVPFYMRDNSLAGFFFTTKDDQDYIIRMVPVWNVGKIEIIKGGVIGY
jgi:dynactin complex subunit